MSQRFNEEINYINGQKKMHIILLWSEITSVPYRVLLMRSHQEFIDEYQWNKTERIWKSIRIMYPQPYSCIIHGIDSNVPTNELLDFCSTKLKEFRTTDCSSPPNEIIKLNEYTTIWLVCIEDPKKMWSKRKITELKKLFCFMDLSDYEQDYKPPSKKIDQ